MASTTDLLHKDQIGSKTQNPAIVTALSLVYNIKLAKKQRLVTLALFLDIKEVYNHVSYNKLLKICRELDLPKSLILWL